MNRPVAGMILAAGYGKRLGVLTATKPKALVEVAGRTFLSLALEKLRRAGVSPVVINSHHMAPDVARATLADAGTIDVAVLTEEMILGTGGGVRAAADRLGKDRIVLVHNVDVLSALSIRDLIERFHREPCDAMLAVEERPTKRPLAMDAARFIVGRSGDDEVREPRGDVTPVGFSGIQILAPGTAGALDGDPPFSIIDALLRLARRGATLRAYPMEGCYWADLGTPERLARARRDIETGIVPLEALLS